MSLKRGPERWLYVASAALVLALVALQVGTAPPAPAAARPAQSITDNLVAWWALDEESGTRYDAHGANDLTDVNTVTFDTGIIGNAAQFTAANSEYLTIDDNAALSSGDIAFTIAIWAYLDNKSESSNPLVWKWTAAGAQSEYYIRYVLSSDTFGFSVSDDGTNENTIAADSLGGVSTGTWYFVVAWHDPSADTINIQIDNGIVDSASHNTGLYDSTSVFNLGATSVLTKLWDGRQDNAAIFKEVLSADQKTCLYNSGAGRAYADLATCDTGPTATPTETGTPVPTATFTPTPELQIVGTLPYTGASYAVARTADFGQILVSAMLMLVAVLLLTGLIWKAIW